MIVVRVLVCDLVLVERERPTKSAGLPLLIANRSGSSATYGVESLKPCPDAHVNLTGGKSEVGPRWPQSEVTSFLLHSHVRLKRKRGRHKDLIVQSRKPIHREHSSVRGNVGSSLRGGIVDARVPSVDGSIFAVHSHRLTSEEKVGVKRS